jgi:hypothetical protein
MQQRMFGEGYAVEIATTGEKKRDKSEINGSMKLQISAAKMLFTDHVCDLVFQPIK